jgi:ABC-type sugar transport system substrate-binding protein
MNENLMTRAATYHTSTFRTIAAACAGIAIAVSLSACSSTGGTISGTKSSASGTNTVTSDCVAKATANVKAASSQMTIQPPAPLDTSSMKGKKFAVIPLTFTPNIVTTDDAIKEALATVGADAIVLNGQGKPDVVTANVQTAISQHVAAIIMVGIAPSVAPAAYAAAKSAGIPAIGVNTGDPHAQLTNVTAVVTPDAAKMGALQIDYGLMRTNCKLHAAVFYPSTAALSVAMQIGSNAEIKKLCPKDCTINNQPFSAATFPTTLPGQVQSILQQSRDTNFVLATSDTIVPYILQGLHALKSTVPLIGSIGDGVPAAIAGNGQTADVQNAPGAVMGYFCADALMRAAAGKPTNQDIPLRLVDASNWGTSGAFNNLYPGLVGYQAVFKKAWGV